MKSLLVKFCFVTIMFVNLPVLRAQDISEETFLLEKFNNYIQNLYLQIDTPTFDYQVFYLAMKGYFTMLHESQIENVNVISIVDFSKPSNQKRFYVIDINRKKLLYETYVAHGKNSGGDFPLSFSNKLGSNKSCYGFFVANETYRGNVGFALRLDGMERNVNNRTRDRGIVIHGAEEVTESYLIEHGTLGHSLGCFSVPQDQSRTIINTVDGESCLFVYYPNDHYLKFSNYLNNNVYLEYFKVLFAVCD